jgi:transposase
MDAKLFVGVDVGSQEHQIEVQDESGRSLWRKRVPNTLMGCQEVVERLSQWREAGHEVWVGLEGLGGYASPLDRMLYAAGIYVVGLHPTQAARYREMRGVQGDKTDELDACLLAELLNWLSRQGKLEPAHERDEYFQALRVAAEHFQNTNTLKVELQNQFTAHVQTYWPELIDGKYFERTDAAGLLMLVSHYSTPRALAKAGSRRIEDLLRKVCRRDCRELTKRLLKMAKEVQDVQPVTEITARVIREEAAMLALEVQRVQKWENLLTQLLREHPFGQFLLDLDGVGPRTAGCFLGEAGELGGFASDAKLARYAGIGPVVSQSGKNPARQHDGHRYNHSLKRAIMMMARSRAEHDERSQAYVAKRRALGDGYWKAIKKLARYLLRFLWKSWQQAVQQNETNLEKILAQGALLP